MALTPAGNVSAGVHHDATTDKQRASASGDCVCCTAHSSHRNSAASHSRRRARRLSGWKHSTRSMMSTAIRHSGSRRTMCASSWASAACCCSRSSSSRNRGGRTMRPRLKRKRHRTEGVGGQPDRTALGGAASQPVHGLEQIGGCHGRSGAERAMDASQPHGVSQHRDARDDQPRDGGDERPPAKRASYVASVGAGVRPGVTGVGRV